MKPLTLILLLLLPLSLFAARQPERKDMREGNRAYNSGDFREAWLSYRRAEEKAPESPNVQFNMGNALYRQVDSTMLRFSPDEARQLQEQARQLFQNAAETHTDHRQVAAAHFNAGNTHLREQNWPAAIEEYKKSLRLNPNDMEAKQNLVFAQAMNEQQPPCPNSQCQDNQDDNDDNNDDQDQNQDQDQDQNEDNQDNDNNDNNNDNNNDRDGQQPQPNISKEDAQRMLDAMDQQERATRERVQAERAEQERRAQGRSSGKNW